MMLWKWRFTVVSSSHASTRALSPPSAFFPVSPLKNTWCKLTLASRESKGRKERGEEGQRSERGADTKRGNFRDCCEV